MDKKTRHDAQQAYDRGREAAVVRPPRILSHLVEVEWDPVFGRLRPLRGPHGERLARLGWLTRSTGIVQGRVVAHYAAGGAGILDVGGTQVFRDAMPRERPLPEAESWFTFWPSVEALPAGPYPAPIRLIRPCRSRPGVTRSVVEVVGRLVGLWPDGFAMATWALPLGKEVFTTFVGKYPYPDEAGKYLRVVGTYEPGVGIRMTESVAISFVDSKTAVAVLSTWRASRGGLARGRERLSK